MRIVLRSSLLLSQSIFHLSARLTFALCLVLCCAGTVLCVALTSISIYQYKHTTVQCHSLYVRKRNQNKRRIKKNQYRRKEITSWLKLKWTLKWTSSNHRANQIILILVYYLLVALFRLANLYHFSNYYICHISLINLNIDEHKT